MPLVVAYAFPIQGKSHKIAVSIGATNRTIFTRASLSQWRANVEQSFVGGEIWGPGTLMAWHHLHPANALTAAQRHPPLPKGKSGEASTPLHDMLIEQLSTWHGIIAPIVAAASLQPCRNKHNARTQGEKPSSTPNHANPSQRLRRSEPCLQILPPLLVQRYFSYCYARINIQTTNAWSWNGP